MATNTKRLVPERAPQFLSAQIGDYGRGILGGGR